VRLRSEVKRGDAPSLAGQAPKRAGAPQATQAPPKKNGDSGWSSVEESTSAGQGQSLTPRVAGGQNLRVPHDPVNEIVMLAACATDPEALARYAKAFPPDAFFGQGHAEAWRVLQELHRQGLAYDPATVRQLASPEVAELLERYVRMRPEAPPNLRHHADMLAWDRARIEAVRGPLGDLHELLRSPASRPEAVRAAAGRLKTLLEREGAMRLLHDPSVLVRERSAELTRRRMGRAVFPFGIDGFDLYEDGTHRIVPGLAPGMLTVICGVPGSAKTTVTARVILAQAFAYNRRVMCGAWEIGAGSMLELCAALHAGWSRTAVMTGQYTEEQQRELERVMDEVAGRVRFFKRPAWSFDSQDGRRKRTNYAALDSIEQYISDVAPDVFFADLFRRCMSDLDPSEEELAIDRMQAMAEQYQCSIVLVQQLKAKDVEQRADKRPTRDAIKGSGAWFENPDTILGVHREALFKAVPDDVLEIFVMKQRHARWPLLVAHDWDSDLGQIGEGRTVENAHVSAADTAEDALLGDSLVRRGTRRKR
jgi:replicative DNA helicase